MPWKSSTTTSTGELAAWAPPPPFAGQPHWRTFTNLPVPWSRSEISGYIDYCRLRVRNALVAMTVEKAAILLPPAHRYRGPALRLARDESDRAHHSACHRRSDSSTRPPSARSTPTANRGSLLWRPISARGITWRRHLRTP